MENILEVKNLTVELGGEEVIKNLSFKVKKSEILTVLGPNGAGKTVLLKALLGILSYKGEVLWREEPKIGYLPQGLSQLKFSDLPISVEEFFNFKERSKEKILRFLDLVGLHRDVLTKRISELSFGQFQRFFIAWVLIKNPSVLFFDEPVTGIDVKGGERIYTLLKDLRDKQGLTILLVTHDLNIVYKYSDNVLCLSKRGFCCFGEPREILSPKMLENLYGGEIGFYQHHPNDL